MTYYKTSGCILAAILAALMSTASAQTAAGRPAGVPELLEKANRAYFTQDYRAFRDAMIGLHRLRPNNSEYMYQLVLAHALLDEKTSAFNIMLQMQRQGLSYDFNQNENSQNLRDTELYAYLNDLMVLAGQPLGETGHVIPLGENVILPEAIAWDAHRDAFLVGTVAGGQVLQVKMDGTTEELFRADDSNGMWGVYDLLVDADRGRLWLSSAATQYYSGYRDVDRGRSALLEFELDSLDLVRRYPVPADGRPHALANMAMAPNGDLYVADGNLPMVYVKRAGEDRLKPFYTADQMVSLRGMSISDDGTNLYVADYEIGISRVNLEVPKPAAFRIPDTLNLGGIDGLYYWQGNLLIIQNGISPQRVMRLVLDEEGGAVVDVVPLAVALEAFDFPNYGTVVGEDLYFFANSHWSSTNNDRKPVNIVSVGLQGLGELKTPEMQRFMEKQGVSETPPQPGQQTGPGQEGPGEKERGLNNP